MRRLPRLVCCWFLLVIASTAGIARADLGSDVDALLGDRLLRRAAVGVEVVRLGGGPAEDATLYRRDAQVPLIPASNLKLLTTAAALQKLGPDFKFRTSFLVGEADVAIVGAGDPSFGDAEFLRPVGWDVTTVFENWADQLVKRKITSVRDVVVDDSIFDEEFLHPNWPPDQIQKRYVAEVGGFNLNANVLEFGVRPTAVGEVATYVTTPDTAYAAVRNTCVSGNDNAIWLSREAGTNQIILRGETPMRAAQVNVAVTIHDPPMYAATVFAEVLRRKGVTVTGAVRRDRTLQAARKAGGAPDRWRVLAIHETPITTILDRANKDSVNVYAESLCKRLGFEATGAAGSWANGTAALGDFLKSIGVPEAEFKLDDGCGLSKQNGISAAAVNRILTHHFHGPHRDLFRGSLAVAGVDGTMQDRFRGSDLKGRVFAKSGYVNNVRALSGYLHARDGQWYAFSILMNRVPESPEVKVIQEKIVKAIDTHAPTLAAGE
jgi:D-alanyl-D-alanine carboxypeptidase/D-alanyl-D-alanine-endopeptidase (penicillin-binding protein 4)